MHVLKLTENIEKNWNKHDKEEKREKADSHKRLNRT